MTARLLFVPALALVWMFRGMIFSGELPFHRDMSFIFVPLKKLLSDRLRAGELPQWWPWDAMGMPLLTVPVLSTFHPSTLAFVALPFHAAFVAQILVVFPIGLLGAWRLGRALGLRPAPAALGATVWSTSAFFVALTEFTSMSLASATLPWLWWAALRCRGHRNLPFVGLAALLALVFLAGDPQVAVMGMIGAAILLVRRASPRRSLRLALGLAAAAVLSLVLSAVQMLPSAMFYSQSPRSTGAAIASPDFWRMEAAQLLGFVHPDAYPPTASLFASTYLGLGVVALALVGALAGGRRSLRLVAIAALFLLLAAGSATPMWGLFSAVVPSWRSFQFPVKTIGPAVLALALLAGRGLQVVTSHRRQRLWPAIAATIAGVVGVVAGWPSATWALLTAASTGVAAARPRLAPLRQVVVVVATSLDLGGGNGPLVPTTDPGFYAPPPLAATLAAAGVSSTGPAFLRAWVPVHGEDPTHDDHLHNAALMGTRNALHGLPMLNGYLQGFSWRYAQLVLDHKKPWVAGVAASYGAAFVVGNPSRATPEQRARAIWSDAIADVFVVPYRRSLPRAYLTSGVRVLPRAEVLPYLYSSAFTPGAEVVLELESSAEVAPRAVATSTRPAAVAVERRGDALEVRTSTSAPAVLVVNEAYFSGVTASIDGAPAVVHPANHAVRAVVVPPGDHVVRFEYATPGLLPGAVISALAWLGAAALGLRAARGRWGV